MPNLGHLRHSEVYALRVQIPDKHLIKFMEEDEDFIALDDGEDDLIELAPPPKRLKSAKSDHAAQPSPFAGSNKRKSVKKTVAQVDENLQNDESPTTARKLKPKTGSSKKSAATRSKAMQLDNADEEDKPEEFDIDNIQWEDVAGDDAEKAQDSPSTAEKENTGHNNDNGHALDIFVGVKDSKEDEKSTSNPKKRKRDEKKPGKKHGTKIQRRFAVDWHNMHLLSWIGHAIFIKRQAESNKLHQALLLSLLPAPLFEEMRELTNRPSPHMKLFLTHIDAITALVHWFHQHFKVIGALTPPNREQTESSAMIVDLTEDEPPATPSRRKSGGSSARSPVKSPSTQHRNLEPHVWRKFAPFAIAAAKPPVLVSQPVAFRLFSVILEALEIPYRNIWYLDKMLVPFKYSDFHLVIPTIPPSLNKWTKMTNLALSQSQKEPTPPGTKKIPSQYTQPDDPPLLWFEIFSPYDDRWIPLDLFRSLVDKAKSWDLQTEDLESPKKPKRRKFGSTQCGYIVAIGHNGKLSHVSPRYTQTYSEPLFHIGDREWFYDMLKSWNVVVSELPSSSKGQNVTRKMLDRMEVADVREIEQVIESEPFPTTMDAYKHHPLYVLERDLLKFEVLRPNHDKPVHRVADQHDVYLRKDVSLIHTADKWIQEGKQVKQGEKPIAEMMKRTGVNWDNAKKTWVDEEEAEMSEYFGDWQVEPYVPPRVTQDGIVPKNRYGNVYLFKPDMLPIGCVHLTPYPQLDKSARKIGVDIAPAMVGWTVEGYWSLPLLDGWIVCANKADMVIDAWHADAAKREADQLKKIRERATQNWLNLAKQLLLKSKMESRSQEKPDTDRESGDQKSSEADGAKVTAEKTENGLAHVGTKRSAQHTHSFPVEWYTTDERGNTRRKCACGYTDMIQQL